MNVTALQQQILNYSYLLLSSDCKTELFSITSHCRFGVAHSLLDALTKLLPSNGTAVANL
jgi:hypothetical protein